MTEEFDAILLDLGGTLVDTRPPKEKVFADVLVRHGLSEERRGEVAEAVRKAEGVFDRDFALLDGENEKEFWLKYDRFVMDELGFEGDSEAAFRDLAKAFRELIPRPESWVVYPDVMPFLEALDRRDFQRGIVSNATDLARKVMDSLGLSRHFDFAIISEEVGFRKPSPEIFMMAVEQAGTTPGRALFFGDKLEVDIKGARAVGMPAVLVDRGDVYSDIDAFRVRGLGAAERFL